MNWTLPFLRQNLPLVNRTLSETFAFYVLLSSKKKSMGVWSILAMLHNASVPCFLSCNNFAWNFWTAGLSCGEAFWETWFFRRAYNLFLLQNPLNQLFEYLRLVTVQNFSNIIFFSFDRNHHPFIPFPRLICSWNCLKSSSSRREYWAFLPRMFLLLLFCFLIFSSPATQFLKCFLLTLNLLAVCNIFLLLL